MSAHCMFEISLSYVSYGIHASFMCSKYVVGTALYSNACSLSDDSEITIFMFVLANSKFSLIDIWNAGFLTYKVLYDFHGNKIAWIVYPRL